MKTQCAECFKIYDDAQCWTYCPHDRFISHEHAKQKDAACALVGKRVAFAHDRTGPHYRVTAVGAVGMVMLDALPGEFAPHIFVEVQGG